jgi:tetratricopeptide (TPR) repeat protein
MKRFRWALLILLIAAARPAWAQRVVVFPLEQAKGTPSTSWIGTGLAVALDEALTHGGVLNIPFEDLRRYYEQGGLVESPTFSLPAQIGLSRQLGAGVLIQGSYEVSGDMLVVQLSAYGLSGDLRLLGEWRESQDLQGLLGLTRKLGEDIFKAMDRTWTPPPQISPQAFESYIRGRITTDPTLQEVYFRKATEIQPDYYDARCYLAMILKDTGRITESSNILVELEKQTYSKAYLGLLTMADIRMDEGKLAEARRLLLASLKASESPEAHIGLARLYLKQMKYKEAQTELVVAEKFGTHRDDIEALRAQIQQAIDKPQPEKAGEEGP